MNISSSQGGVGALWRIFFWVAAAFNFLVGFAGMISPAATLDARVVGLLVFCFGTVYMLVARDPLRFRPVLWAGVIGKLGVVGLLGPGAMGSEGDGLVLGALAFDALSIL